MVFIPRRFWTTGIFAVLWIILAACDQKPIPATPSIESLQSDATPAITLKWSAVAQASSYSIERKTGADGSYSLLATKLSSSAAATSLSYTDSTVSFSTQYFYRVKAVGDGGSSTWAEQSITTPAPPQQAPGVPQNFSATLGNVQIVLTWQAPAIAVSQYVLERKVDSGTYTALTQTPDLAYTDSAVSPGSSYQYRIKATNSAGGSTFVESSPITVVPPLNLPGLPSSVLAYAASSSQVQVGWQAPSTGGAVASYTLQRQLANGTFGSDQTLTQASFSDTSVSSARTYTYRVRANNVAGSSDWVLSNPVPVPQACATGASTASSKGCFGQKVTTWPLVPTFSALLPTGNVIAWYASDDVGKYRERQDVHNTTPRTVAGLGAQDGSLVAIWNPASGSFDDASFGQRDNASGASKGTDLFCAGYTVLNNGSLFTAGGNIGLTFGSIRLNVFDPVAKIWENGPGPSTPNMWRDRWYPTVTKLPDGRVFIAGGTAIKDGTFVDGITDKETAIGDPSRANTNICRTATGVCPPGLQGQLAPLAGTDPSQLGIRGNTANTGYNNSFEIYDPATGGLSMLGVTAADVPSFEHYYPWFHVMPNGNLFLAGASYEKRVLNVAGAGSWASSLIGSNGQRPYGTSVLVRPNKDLVIGGGYAFGGPGNVSLGMTAIGNSTLGIDLSTNTPTITDGPPMTFKRTHAMSTLLANGQVLVTGGQQNGGESATGSTFAWEKTVNSETLWNLDLAVKTAEIYNPTTNSFSLAAKADEERMYHSIAMLLPDATVLTAGGGGCGVCADTSLSPGVYGALDAPKPEERGTGTDTNLTTRQTRTNKKNHEIYYPAYMFKSNGSLAVRPVITATNIPTVAGYPTIAYNSSFTLNWAHPEAAHSIGKVTFVALGAPTHAFNQNQRYLELPFTNSGNTLTITTPSTGQYGSSSGRNIAPPGFYMVFILDDLGVPSVAKIVRIQ